MKALIALFLLLAATVAQAEDKPYRFGAQVAGARYSLKDPDGSTAPGSGYSFGGVAAIELARGGRCWLSAGRGMYTLKASVSDIGQDVSATELGLSYQSNFRMSRGFKPWLGVGVGYAVSKYTSRNTSASAGSSFSNILPNRSANNVAALLNANNEWQISEDLDLGIQVQAAIPAGKGATVIGFGVYLLY